MKTLLILSLFISSLFAGGGGDILRANCLACLVYTADAADDLLCGELGGGRISKKKRSPEPKKKKPK